ncbi:MAG: hypothetical protein ABIO46_15290 [Chitinophagales bacterium]
MRSLLSSEENHKQLLNKKIMGFLNKLFGGAKEEGQGMAAQMIGQLTSDLNLNTDQLEKMKGAFQQFREKRKAAKESGGDMKSKMQGIKQELKTQIQGVLSDEQKQKFMTNIDKYKDFFQK